MKLEQAKALREPFKPEQIGKLPKPTKKDNPRGKCNECGGYHGLPAVHLDYVGHAAVTDRLLQVDPAWTWEPAAIGPNGEPLVTNGGLWIKLTVAGVTRYGFGDEGNGKGMKEMIGDAIRNAAMRFGVALDLWAKEDLHASDEPEASKMAASAPAAKPAPSKAAVTASGAGASPVVDADLSVSGERTLAALLPPGVVTGTAALRARKEQVTKLDALVATLKEAGRITDEQMKSATKGRTFQVLTEKEADDLIARLERFAANVKKEEAA